LARGIQYTFITHVDEADVPGQALAQIAMQKSGLVKIRNIPEDEFKRLAATDYVIVNPDGTPSPPRVFLELPIAQRGYWIEVDGLAAMNFVARFRELAIRDVQPPDNAGRATASAG
jgi:hypothetical protein